MATKKELEHIVESLRDQLHDERRQFDEARAADLASFQRTLREKQRVLGVVRRHKSGTLEVLQVTDVQQTANGFRVVVI